MTQYRIKTEQEFIDEFGEDWRDLKTCKSGEMENIIAWHREGGMDNLFGLPVDYETKHIAYGWYIHDNMITDKPLPGADKIQFPEHYTSGNIECIDAIRSALTPEEFRGYCKGNILKYTWREKMKNGDEDMQKAQKYIEFLLKV